MLSPSLEDYLEELYRTSLKNSDIRNKDIADCLGVSMPSVVKGLKRLHKLGYIDYKPYQEIILLDKAVIKGRFLVERNRILREFVDIIGADCDIKAEAEAMEHYLSKTSIRSIEKLTRFLQENKEVLSKLQNFTYDSILHDDEEEDLVF